jgi:hypothetical protein
MSYPAPFCTFLTLIPWRHPWRLGVLAVPSYPRLDRECPDEGTWVLWNRVAKGRMQHRRLARVSL